MHYKDPPSIIKVKGKKPKCGKENSEYCLKVVFLPAFAKPRAVWHYNSDIIANQERARDDLMRRVLNGSCAGRYSLAELIHNPTGKVLETWQAPKAALKLYVICRADYAEKIAKNGMKHPLTIPSTDVCHESGIMGEDAALKNFRHLLSTKPLLHNVVSAIVYRQGDNRRVGKYDHRAYLTFLDEDFKRLMLSKGNFADWEMGYFDSYATETSTI